MNNNTRIRRMLAYVIDWNLCWVPLIIYISLFSEYFRRPSLENVLLILGFMLLSAASPVLFIFRDVIIKGRSIGKRIFGLRIVDVNSGENASTGKKILRNVFFFIAEVDFFILITTKRTIGDRIASTSVVKK